MATIKNGAQFSLILILISVKLKTVETNLNSQVYTTANPVNDEILMMVLQRPIEEKRLGKWYDPVISLTSTMFTNGRRPTNRNKALHSMAIHLLLCCGDVINNPGPTQRTPKYPCTVCDKGVISKSKAVSCDSCSKWTHVRCSDVITVAEYDRLVEENTDFNFICITCMLKELPAGLIEDADYEPQDTTAIQMQNPANPKVDDDPVNTPKEDQWAENFPRKGLHMIHINARSLRHKIHEVSIIARSTHAGIIGITETWFDESITEEEASIEGYNIIRNDRTSLGGGVCLYIKEELTFNPRSDITNENIEGIWIDLLLPKTKPILIGCVYRPPHDKDFVQQLEETITGHTSDKETYIIGDININVMNSNSTLVKDYFALLKRLCLHQIIKNPTRITCNSSSLIDHIIVSNLKNVLNYGVLAVGISDHCMTYVTRKTQREKISKENIIHVRSLKNYTKEALVTAINSQNWSSVVNCNCTNTAWVNFEQIFSKIIDKIAPSRQRKIKMRNEPWMSPEIFEHIQERNKTLRKFNKTRDESTFKDFCKLRNKTQRLIRQARKDYILKETEKHKNNSKKLWNTLSSLGYRQKCKSKEPIILNINNQTCYDPVTISESVNTYFINVAQNLVSALPCFVDIYSAFSKNCRKFYSSMGITPSKFKISPVSTAFINRELRNLDASKATGLDRIGPRFLNDGAEALTNIISHLVNLSITSKTVPNCTKRAKVTPIFKKGSKLEVGNYRPVSILTSVSKILEKAVHHQVDKYCRETRLLYIKQSGFRNNYSTSTCLVYLHDYIRSEVEKGKFIGMVMLDVQKAFDSVNHDLLCEKIRLAGIEPEWFRSYLSNRKQLAFVNGTFSGEQTIKCGVPQGSILGPWCYLIYCNDMPSCVSKCQMIIYADDTILITSNQDLKAVKDELGDELQKCYRWLTDNKLSMHKGKTEALVITSKKKQHKTQNFTISIGNYTTNSSKEVKYLGLTINNSLSGDEIVNSIVSKTTNRLKFLYRHRELLNSETRKLLAKSLIFCHFDYAIAAWYMSLSLANKKRLQVAQNKAVRFMLNLGSRVHIGQNELDRVGLLCVNDRARQIILHLMYDIFRESAPEYLYKQFHRNNSKYITRSNPNSFIIPRTRGIAEFNFNVVGAQEWNNLPNNIKLSSSKALYKKLVRSFLKTQAHNRENSEYVSY